MSTLTIETALEQYSSAICAYPVAADSSAGQDFASRLRSKRNLKKVESAIGEAVAWEYLKHRVDTIEAVEPVQGARTPDFRCTSSGSPFFVEVQVITTETVTKWTGLDAHPTGPRPFGPVGTWARKFQGKLSRKTTQGVDTPIPRLVFFLTLHAEATLSRCTKHDVEEVMHSSSFIASPFNPSTGEGGAAFHAVDFHHSAFTNRSLSPMREPISGFLVGGFGYFPNHTRVFGGINPDASHPFDPSWLPSVPLASFAAWPLPESGEVHFHWSRADDGD